MKFSFIIQVIYNEKSKMNIISKEWWDNYKMKNLKECKIDKINEKDNSNHR